MRHAAGRALIYGAAVLIAAWVLFPLFLIAMAAFSPRAEIYKWPKSLIPSQLSLETFLFFLHSHGVLESTLNSIGVALLTIAFTLLLGAPAGYAIARYLFAGREAFKLGILMTKMFPVVILSIPLAVSFIRWGLYDTLPAVALLHTALALPFAIMITASVFAGVPRDLEEAALTLGCSRLQAFLRVALPLALPGLAAAALFTFVMSWNEVFAAIILTVHHRTLPAQVLVTLNESPLPFRFAGGFFMIIPALIVIFLIRRYLISLWGATLR